MLAQNDEARALDRKLRCPKDGAQHVVHGFTGARFNCEFFTCAVTNINMVVNLLEIIFRLNFIPERRHIWHGVLDNVIVPLEPHLLQNNDIVGLTSQDVRQGSEPLLKNFEKSFTVVCAAIFCALTYCDMTHKSVKF